MITNVHIVKASLKIYQINIQERKTQLSPSALFHLSRGVYEEILK